MAYYYRPGTILGASHVSESWLANDITSRYSPKYADHYKRDDISKNTLPEKKSILNMFTK